MTAPETPEPIPADVAELLPPGHTVRTVHGAVYRECRQFHVSRVESLTTEYDNAPHVDDPADTLHTVRVIAFASELSVGFVELHETTIASIDPPLAPGELTT